MMFKIILWLLKRKKINVPDILYHVHTHHYQYSWSEMLLVTVERQRIMWMQMEQ